MLTCVTGGSNLGLWDAVLVVLGVPKVADQQQRLGQPLHRLQQQVVQLDVPVGHALGVSAACQDAG